MGDNKYSIENFNHGKIKQVNISKEVRDSFLDYSMSVIVSRALPDVRDGLKPVHRRILYAMHDMGMTYQTAHKKSARIVGEVLGKYHPHGDSAVYESMVRMAQTFSYRYPLIDGHGNFGSIDGDEAAAMRYTEARMAKITAELLRDIQKETVDWVDNYDASEKEPAVLPSKFPNLLVNGSTGIAVGMATNMPPHQLGESIDAIIAVMDNPDITVQELMENYIFGPDFPTGAYIVGRTGIKQAYETGRGSIVIRSKVDVEDMANGKKRIIVKEIPYQVNKSALVEKIVSLAREKTIDGIVSLNDESNREGIKIIIELRKDVQPEVILNQLYKLTSLQTTFGVNNVVLVNNKPQLLGLKPLLEKYIDHQIEIVKRATAYDLKKAEDRAHILEGLKIALDNIDDIIETIKTSKDNADALEKLMERFGLTEIQAKAILDMQLRRLSGLERDKILNELDRILITIKDLKDILANHYRVVEIIKNDLLEIKEHFNDKRLTQIIEGDLDVEDEDLIPVSDIIVQMTTKGYIKRLPEDTYKTQNRGGVGVRGMAVNEDDVIDQSITMSTHDYLCLFTNKGKVYRIKGYQVPAASKNSKGIPTVNLINIEKDEVVKALVSYKQDMENDGYVFFITKYGLCKRVNMSEFDSIRQNGKIAITLKDDDELVAVKLTTGNDDVIVGSDDGKAAKFSENGVRAMGRTATGVIGLSTSGNQVVGMCNSKDGKYILVVSENGYGKLTPIDEYRLTNRGTKGVKTITVNDKTGKLVSIKAVNGDEDCMIMTSEGVVIRFHLSKLSVQGRATQGVRLMKPKEGTIVSAVTILEHQELEEENEIDLEQESE